MSATLEAGPDRRAPSTAEIGLRGERMPHLPGLDGLRGLAVVGVLLFHGGFAWAEGGFLGVSTFFTLSGFLITNLLVREFDRSDTIALGRFWVRRLRRLLPAALVTIALVGVVWWRIGSPEQLAELRGDMLGSLAYVANWRFLGTGTSYADLFSAPSPLQHFWSLAIEEQFYLFFPPLAWGLLKLGGRRLLTTVLVAAAAASVLLQLALGDDVDRAYYGTDTRASELLVGVLLALWWSSRVRPAPARSGASAERGRTLTAVADLVGGVSLLAVLVAWTSVAQTSTRLTHGGFTAYALATAAVIWAATRPGLVARLLSIPLLRGIGLISYGLYLYHWPIFLWLDQERTGFSTGPLFVVRMAVTTGVALLSYVALEQPVRRGTLVRTHRALLGAAVAGAVVVAATAWVVTLDPPASQVPYADTELGAPTITVVEQDPTATPPGDGVDGAAVARTVVLLGDSAMMDATPALTAAFTAAGATTVVQGAQPGFKLSEAPWWRDQLGGIVERYDPDLVVTMFGGWDARYVEQNGTGGYRDEVRDAAEVLSAGGAHLLWLPILPGGQGDREVVDAVFAELPDAFPGVVANPDIDDSLRGPDGGFPRSYDGPDGATVLLRKTDGWHLCQAGAERLTEAIIDETARLGWSTLPATEWRDGTWRSSEVFDDPPGVCDLR